MEPIFLSQGHKKKKMLWQLAVIIVLVIFILFLVFRLFAMQVTLNDTAYSLMMQTIILRDVAMSYVSGYPGVNTSELIFNSFWTQGIIGDLLIERHRLFLAYIECNAGRSPPSWATQTWRYAIPLRIQEIDMRLTKSLSFDISRTSDATLSMIHKIFMQQYDQTLLAARGVLSSVH